MHMHSYWSWYSHTTPLSRYSVINVMDSFTSWYSIPFEQGSISIQIASSVDIGLPTISWWEVFINTRLSSGRPRWSVFSRNTQQLFAVYSKPATQRRIGVNQSRYRFSPRAVSSCSHWHPEWVIQLPLRSLTFLWRGEHEINKWKLIILNTFKYIMGPWLLGSEDDTGDQTRENEEAAEWEVGGLGEYRL